MESDGNSVVHHAEASATDCCALCRIVPHDQLPGSPRPRKDSPASASTAREVVSTTDTPTTGMTPGSRCLRTIQSDEPPTTLAAETNGMGTMDSACERTTRAT